jgi:hypothetical protein
MSEEIKQPTTPNIATEQGKGRCAPALGSAAWRKQPPDIPGWWLVAYRDAAGWAMFCATREPDKPWMTQPEWWYQGPVLEPNARGELSPPTTNKATA